MEEHININSDIVDEKLKGSLEEHKNSLLHDMERIVEQISAQTNVTQLNQISSLVSGVPSLKTNQMKNNLSTMRK